MGELAKDQPCGSKQRLEDAIAALTGPQEGRRSA
jgi:hypothetical protein